VKKVSLIALIGISAIVLLLALSPFVMGGIGGGLEFYELLLTGLSASDEYKPEITYGEFPFTLVYEADGEEKRVEDVLICKYDGIEWVGDFTFSHRKWKCSYKSGNERLVLLKIDETDAIYYIMPSSPDYQMGFGEKPAEDTPKNAWRCDAKENPDFVGVGAYVGEEELLSKYGLSIKSFEIAPPIVNSIG
jgi:hypothetical protein